MTEIRVLTVKQPWAALIVSGGKDVENRAWSTPYRGTVAIHAGLGIDSTAMVELSTEHTAANVHTRGAILGLVDLVDVVTDSRSDWAEPTQYHWILANPRPLDHPLEHTGGLGLRRLNSATVEVILDLLAHQNPNEGTN